jgi:hypothetical protein
MQSRISNGELYLKHPEAEAELCRLIHKQAITLRMLFTLWA